MKNAVEAYLLPPYRTLVVAAALVLVVAVLNVDVAVTVVVVASVTVIVAIAVLAVDDAVVAIVVTVSSPAFVVITGVVSAPVRHPAGEEDSQPFVSSLPPAAIH